MPANDPSIFLLADRKIVNTYQAELLRRACHDVINIPACQCSSGYRFIDRHFNMKIIPDVNNYACPVLVHAWLKYGECYRIVSWLAMGLPCVWTRIKDIEPTRKHLQIFALQLLNLAGRPTRVQLTFLVFHSALIVFQYHPELSPKTSHIRK